MHDDEATYLFVAFKINNINMMMVKQSQQRTTEHSLGFVTLQFILVI